MHSRQVPVEAFKSLGVLQSQGHAAEFRLAHVRICRGRLIYRCCTFRCGSLQHMTTVPYSLAACLLLHLQRELVPRLSLDETRSETNSTRSSDGKTCMRFNTDRVISEFLSYSWVHSPCFFASSKAMASQQPWAAAHQRALEAGEKFYKDPDTGLMVMTELIHKQRGKCCGSGCRHCPYAHDRVPMAKRAQLIKQPAWLAPPNWATRIQCESETVVSQSGNGTAAEGFKVVVLFWSTGKDSFLAYRALCRATAGKQTKADPPIPVRFCPPL